MANITEQNLTMTPAVIGYQIGKYTFAVSCPHCGKTHTHGIAGGLGYRAPDCGMGYEYQITEIKNEKQTFKNRAKSSTK